MLNSNTFNRGLLNLTLSNDHIKKKSEVFIPEYKSKFLFSAES